jgi:predicted ATPase
LSSAEFFDPTGCAAELHRLKGECTLEADPAATADAEICFQQAIQIAQQQSSRSMQLRAMTSLAAVWHGQGRTQEAKMMLQFPYSTFTEGLQTPDLLRARELLDSMQ